jgi:hypothetical protein
MSFNSWTVLFRNLAADDAVGGNLTRFKVEVKQLAEMGVNNVRIVSARPIARMHFTLSLVQEHTEIDLSIMIFFTA